MTNERYVMQCW